MRRSALSVVVAAVCLAGCDCGEPVTVVDGQQCVGVAPHRVCYPLPQLDGAR